MEAQGLNRGDKTQGSLNKQHVACEGLTAPPPASCRRSLVTIQWTLCSGMQGSRTHGVCFLSWVSLATAKGCGKEKNKET